MKKQPKEIYCTFGLICQNSTDCKAVLTNDVLEEAKESNQEIHVYETFPDCFVPWFVEIREK